MYTYPGNDVLERARAAKNANPGVKLFSDLYQFVLTYSRTYTTKAGKVYTGRFGVDGAVKKAFGLSAAAHVVR